MELYSRQWNGRSLKLSSSFRMVTVLSTRIFTGAVQLSRCLVLWLFQVADKQYHDTLYSCLLKEHLELQREYQFLQNRLQRVRAEPNRTRLKLEHELAAAVTNVRKLQRLLAEQEGTEGRLSLWPIADTEIDIILRRKTVRPSSGQPLIYSFGLLPCCCYVNSCYVNSYYVNSFCVNSCYVNSCYVNSCYVNSCSNLIHVEFSSQIVLSVDFHYFNLF